MNDNEKAVAQLESTGIAAKVENGTVYVYFDEQELEISEFEINYQAREFDGSIFD